ncbi:MAG: hypothetical protein ACTSRZ_05895 [Promethearchaeota archaeon]
MENPNTHESIEDKKIPKNSKQDKHPTNPDNFKNLDHLFDYILTLMHQINSGDLNAYDLNLVPIFQAFQQLNISINSDISKNATDLPNLIKIIDHLSIAEDLFQEKIKEIKEYIQEIDDISIIKQFIDKFAGNTNALSKIIHLTWKPPLIIENISNNYLISSFKKWTKKRMKSMKNQIIDPPKVKPAKIPDDFFQTFDLISEVNNFFSTIKPKLPCTIMDILRDYDDINEGFKYFTYLLQLIHEKKIKYDKKSQNLSLIQN